MKASISENTTQSGWLVDFEDKDKKQEVRYIYVYIIDFIIIKLLH